MNEKISVDGVFVETEGGSITTTADEIIVGQNGGFDYSFFQNIIDNSTGDAINKYISSIVSTVHDHSTTITKIEKLIASFKTSLSNSSAQILTIKEAHASDKLAWAKEIKELQASFNSANSSLKQNLTTYASEIEAYSTRVLALKVNIDKATSVYNNNITSLTKKIDNTLIAQNSLQTNLISKIEENKQLIDTQEATFKKSIDTLTKQSISLTKSLDNTKSTLSNFQTSQASKNNELASTIGEQASSFNESIQTTNNKVESLTKSLDNTKSTLSSFQTSQANKNQNLSASIDNTIVSVNSLEYVNINLQKDTNNIKKEVNILKNWSGGVKNILTSPNGENTGFDFGSSSNEKSHFNIFADNINLVSKGKNILGVSNGQAYIDGAVMRTGAIAWTYHDPKRRNVHKNQPPTYIFFGNPVVEYQIRKDDGTFYTKKGHIVPSLYFAKVTFFAHDAEYEIRIADVNYSMDGHISVTIPAFYEDFNQCSFNFIGMCL